MLDVRHSHAATLLHSGQVLLTGGNNYSSALSGVVRYSL